MASGLESYQGQAVNWQAIVCTPSVSPVGRLSAAAEPIYLVDGSLVAAGNANLWNSLALDLNHAIYATPPGTALLSTPAML